MIGLYKARDSRALLCFGARDSIYSIILPLHFTRGVMAYVAIANRVFVV